ncbi:hypothetical protein WA158_004870 [Blastocystis sp. Blastoise]
MQRLLLTNIRYVLPGRNVVRVFPSISESCRRYFSEEVKPVVSNEEKKTSDTKTKAVPTPQAPKKSILAYDRTWIQMKNADGKVYYQNKKTLEIVYALDNVIPYAPLWRRFTAGLIDTSISLGVGAAVTQIATLELNDPGLGFVMGAMYLGLSMLIRDSLFEEKTRSLGKRLMKLEILTNDGRISGPYRNAVRNAPWGLLVMASSLGPLGSSLFLFTSIFDLACMLIFKKRIFEYPMKTRVVMEQPERKKRLLVFKEDIEEKERNESLETSGMTQSSVQNYDPDKMSSARYM